MTDLRDGKTYKTVTILGQEWMAENLNLEYNVGTAKSGCLMVKGNFPGCDFFPSRREYYGSLQGRRLSRGMR